MREDYHAVYGITGDSNDKMGFFDSILGKKKRTLADIPNGGDAKVLIRGRISDSATETIEMVFAATSLSDCRNM